MKLNKTMIMILIVIVAIVILTIIGVCMYRYYNAPMLVEVPSGEHNVPSSVFDIVEGKELLCTCENEETAQSIAKAYGIELVSFSSRIAVFHTDEDPKSLIEWGKSKGLPELSMNHYVQLD